MGLLVVSKKTTGKFVEESRKFHNTLFEWYIEKV
jgi:hypothetical protein